jgi:hypothetical protein
LICNERQTSTTPPFVEILKSRESVMAKVIYDRNHDEPEPSGKSQYRDTRFAAAAKDPPHSFEMDPVNE